MKLITVNMEGYKHLDQIISLIYLAQPDCLCLQEAPEGFIQNLRELNYHAEFAPMQKRDADGNSHMEGLIIASQLPFVAKATYYAEIGTDSEPVTIGTRRVSTKFPYLIADIHHPDEGTFKVATVHLPVTVDGLADERQVAAVRSLLSKLEPEEPHVLCGDFNMPRGFNSLYEEIIEKYTDTIPAEFTSSLDKNRHRLGKRTDLNSPIFESYMIDYIFTKEVFAASNIRLQFGVSDHAAVIADISRVQK